MRAGRTGDDKGSSAVEHSSIVCGEADEVTVKVDAAVRNESKSGTCASALKRELLTTPSR